MPIYPYIRILRIRTSICLFYSLSVAQKSPKKGFKTYLDKVGRDQGRVEREYEEEAREKRESRRERRGSRRELKASTVTELMLKWRKHLAEVNETTERGTLVHCMRRVMLNYVKLITTLQVSMHYIHLSRFMSKLAFSEIFFATAYTYAIDTHYDFDTRYSAACNIRQQESL